MGPQQDKPDPPVAPAPTAPTAGTQSMASDVGRGMAWLMVNIGASKLLVVAAQVLLGWLLSPEEFGIYAISVAITSLVTVFKDGGIRELLVQRHNEYNTLVGPVFWLGVVVNVFAGLVLAAIAPLAAYVYDDQSLFWMVLVTAIWIPVSSTYSIQYVKLRLDLRFKAVAWIGLGSCVVRYGGQVALALAGFGAISFVLPLLAVALWEGAAGYLVTREWPWRHPVDRKRWPELMRSVKWILWGNLMAGGLGQSYYLVLGLFVDKDVIGVYFFALSLLVQIESVIGFNLQQVLPPVFARFKDDRERLGGAALRTIRATCMLTVPVAMGLAVVFRAVEQMITMWDGKWAPAVWPVFVLALGYPMRMVFVGVTSPLLQARGLWARWAWMWTLNAVGITVVAALVGWKWETPLAIASAVSIFMIVTGLWATVREMSSLGVGPWQVVKASTSALLIGAACAGLVQLVKYHVYWDWPPLLRMFISATMFGASFLLAVRALLPSHLGEGLMIAPRGIAGRAARVLRLEIPGR